MTLPEKVFRKLEPVLCNAHTVILNYKKQLDEKAEKTDIAKELRRDARKHITTLNRWIDYCIAEAPCRK